MEGHAHLSNLQLGRTLALNGQVTGSDLPSIETMTKTRGRKCFIRRGFTTNSCGPYSIKLVRVMGSGGKHYAFHRNESKTKKHTHTLEVQQTVNNSRLVQ